MDDDKIEQEIRTMNAQASYVNSEQTLEVVRNQAASDVNVAELTLEFAIQDLEQYKVGQYPNELTAANASINLAQEELTRAEETLSWSKRLYEEKYISQTELRADELSVSRYKNSLQLAENDLELLRDFTYKRQIKQLESDVEQAEMALFRARAKAKADVVQAEADYEAKKQEYNRQQAKLDKLLDQISKATVRAPADGMVIYATTARRGGWRDNREPLDEGVEVWERQELIYLPTADSAMAEVDIHEASLEKVRLGLPAVITVDALLGQTFMGTVGRISPLPDPGSMWMNPDLKVYNSDIYLEADAPDLRTGMSCKVEIIVAQYEDAIYIPVHAVIRVAGKPTVYVVLEDGTVEERPVEIGLDNNRMVRIVSGLSEGEIVWLAPPLQSAAVESGSEMGGAGSEPNSGSEAMMRRINQKLEEVNGAYPAGGGGDGLSSPGARKPDGQGNRQGPPADQVRQTSERARNLTPQQRQKSTSETQSGGQAGQQTPPRPQGDGGSGGSPRPSQGSSIGGRQ